MADSLSSNVDLPPADRRVVSATLPEKRARRLLAAVLILFVVAVALQLHGSSIAVWKAALKDESSPSGIIFSSAKSVRSDEWMAWTPSVLSQAFHRPSFPVENANLGAAKTPLLISVPVRHFAMLFRPQLYGFFVFDIETAFAFYWNAKICVLFVSFFLLCRLLTKNDFWISVFGATWLLFSAYVQWWFSCPPMMPEMLASWAMAILCAIHLFRTKKLVVRVVMVLLLVIAGVNFTLCFYPPFQIPLAYLGLILVAGCLWQNKHEALRWHAGIVSIVVAAAGLAAVLVPYILEVKPTLELLSQTQYPGSRRTHGGELTLTDAFNGVLGFFNASERVYLPTRGNSCEASNFYPLWVLALVGSGLGLWRDRHNRKLELLLLGSVSVFTLYIFCPFPEWLCHWTLLNYVTGTRMLLSAGIGGVLLTTILLAGNGRSLNTGRPLVAAGIVVFSIAILFAASYPGNEKFLTPGRLTALVLLNLLFIGLYFFAPRKVFCAAFLLALVVNNGAINPVATGLGPLLEAAPSSAIREIRESDPDAKWIVYSTAWLPQFFKAQGVEVVNGLQVVPHTHFCSELDPARRYEAIWNRYAFVVLENAQPTEPPEFRPMGPSAYILKVAPANPVLRALGTRYAVFSAAPEAPEKSGLTFAASFPANKIWIYKLMAE